MKTIYFVLEVVVTILILCFFSITYNHFVMPQIDYIRFLHMMPGKYINEHPYEKDGENFLMYNIKEQYRLHVNNHKTIDEIYSCEASEKPCYVSVNVWVISESLGAVLTMGEKKQNSDIAKILVEGSLATNLNLKEKQTVLLKSAANEIKAEVVQVIPYSGFPEYQRESTKSIFLILSGPEQNMMYGDFFSINSNHKTSLKEFDISRLSNRSQGSIIGFYMMCFISFFCLIICCFAINWNILELKKYYSHLYMLGASCNRIRFKKFINLLMYFLCNCLLVFAVSFIMNDNLTKLFFISIAISYFCLFLWVLIK